MIGICSAACGQRKSATLLEECGDDIFLSPVTTRSPPHQSPSVPASPRGEAYVLCYVEVITTIFFYINLKGLPIAFPWGGRWAGEAGSDEGVPGGFHGVGNRPTGPRWQRDSSTHRHDHIAPSSVTFGASFPPRGSLRALLCWGFCYGCFLLSSVFISRISVFFVKKI